METRRAKRGGGTLQDIDFLLQAIEVLGAHVEEEVTAGDHSMLGGIKDTGFDQKLFKLLKTAHTMTKACVGQASQRRLVQGLIAKGGQPNPRQCTCGDVFHEDGPGIRVAQAKKDSRGGWILSARAGTSLDEVHRARPPALYPGIRCAQEQNSRLSKGKHGLLTSITKVTTPNTEPTTNITEHLKSCLHL